MCVAPEPEFRRVLEEIRICDWRLELVHQELHRLVFVDETATTTKLMSIGTETGSDSILMKLRRYVALVSQRNQRDASTASSLGSRSVRL